MRSVWILGLPFLLALSGAVAAPQQAAAYDGDSEYCENDDLGSEVAVRYFRDDLGPHGRWFRVPRYGWAWRPYGVAAHWRPYTRGRWIDTDYGWTWVSDEPWGWAPYHYGRWAWDEQNDGWIWIPGRCWSPAWVDWREGDGYLGWAPLPPAAVWRRGVGIPTRTIVIEPRHYCFVETRRVIEPHVERFAAPPARNVTIIRNTTNVTNYTIVNNRIANRSVREETVERATGRPLPRYPVTEVESAAPRAFHARPETHERAPSVTVREAPPPAVERHGAVGMVRDRRDRRDRIDAQRERAAIEQTNAERMQDEQRRREAVQRQEMERQGQELRRRDALERTREAARQETMRREQIERAREGAAHGAREDAIRRQQAEARHPVAPQPPAPQSQRLPPIHAPAQPPQPQHQPALPFGAGQAAAGHD
jgi:hypothetical protein